MSSVTRNHLLIELGTEELPPKALKALSRAFTNEIKTGLLEAQLIASDALVTPYAAPRRLAVLISDVASAQADQTVDRRGPALQAAFKDGVATPAAQGFAKSCGVEVDQLERLVTDKGEWLSYTLTESGQAINAVVQSVLDQAIKRLPIPKRMRWGDSDVEFVRPAKWLLALYGNDLLDINCLGLSAGRTSRGHRFHSEALVEHATAADYKQSMLEVGHVVASFTARQATIKQQIEALAESVKGQLADDQDLLDEVTGLVEFPRSVLGRFDESFLDVPQECLVSSMRDHQKYFHVMDSAGKLLPYFITVSNILSKDEDRMVQGNERVLRARLSDAEFFWTSDQKTRLEDRVKDLGSVLFHAKLGTVLEKTTRVQALAGKLAKALDGDADIAERGAYLAKADLISNMVGEFDELQGVMGHYYADRDGEPTLVGECVEQHYWPKFAGDQLPQSVEAQAVAMADKLDSLVGIYAAGEVPTGDKDPYALRRASLSILRILIEKEHSLELSDLIDWSADAYQAQEFKIAQEVRGNIVDFIRGRLTAYYQSQNIATATINAVAACAPNSPLDFENRLKAVDTFSQLDEAVDLAAANKRISNILKKQDVNQNVVDSTHLVETAEQHLYQVVTELEADCNALFDAGDYSAGLQKLAALRGPVDEFFDQVMVMSDNAKQQANRLALLKQVQDLFLRVADISLLQS
jgi:glycyl-tRNA synthetase beta chain